MSTPLAEIAAALADVSPAWADVVTVPSSDAARATTLTRSTEIQRGVEAIREGWLLHRGASRIAAGASPDLALLIGDWSYAAGLVDIAEHGSLDDVAQLAELVAQLSTQHERPLAELEQHWDTTFETLAAAPS
ncbi:MAG: hypothetical protein JWM25_1299 [Thermoleophilia bacterium]|nr:hypothetical protein [Thermoleophilia bacterium]MCZ4496716.1 hypothetical protein [Thermoleophilia bacterium]